MNQLISPTQKIEFQYDSYRIAGSDNYRNHYVQPNQPILLSTF